MKRALQAILLLSAVASCASYDTSDREAPPPGQQGAEFRPVALVLLDRCGSIDCHGSKYRNFRLFGFGSARLDPNFKPGTRTDDMTAAEVAENYASLVALEPQILQEVIREGGREPERLTFIRKARERESHKGGKRIVEGDPADLCIQSWLQSQVQPDLCRSAVPRLNE